MSTPMTNPNEQGNTLDVLTAVMKTGPELSLHAILQGVQYLVANTPPVKQPDRSGKGRCGDPDCCPPVHDEEPTAAVEVEVDEASRFTHDETRIRATWTMRSRDAAGFMQQLQAWAADRPEMPWDIALRRTVRHLVEDIEPAAWVDVENIGGKKYPIKTALLGRNLTIDRARQLAAELLSACARAEHPEQALTE